jgi:dolichyl-phosphate-mannose-protein mannosyltransferase
MSDPQMVDARPAAPPRAWLQSIPAHCLAAVLLLLAYRAQLQAWFDRHPRELGALRPRHLLPLISRRGWSVGLWLLPAVAVVAGFVLLTRLVYLRSSLRPLWMLALSVVFFFAIGTSVAMIDGYIPTLQRDVRPAVLYPYTQPFASYADVPKVEAKGPSAFLRNFPRRTLNDNMANHSRTHPPGPILFLWAAQRLFGPGLVPAWLATVIFTSLATVPVFFLARDLYGEPVARRAVALFLLTPNLILFSTTSMDGPMTVFLIVALWSFLRATREGGRGWLGAVLSGMALALASFMTYTATFLALYFAVTAVLAFFLDRARFRRIVRIVPVAALSALSFYGVLFLATGYDPIAAVRRSVWANNELVGTGHATLDQYLQVSGANLVAFLVGIGLPLVVVWLRQVRLAVARARAHEEADLFVLAFPIALLVIAFSSLYTLETERIWMFMAAFLAVAAACYLYDREQEGAGAGPFYWTAGLLALQVVVMETFSDTLW